ncbi:MAG: hypothetical protein QM831_38640 [Kofleriaceae bacterium]
MRELFRRLFAPPPAPRASVGRNATPAMLLRMFELFPDERIGVVDEHQHLVAVLDAKRVKSRLARRDVATVAELLG